ncbi:Glucose-6-phosphate 1-epimerase [Heracleum sosnowskyi]|uniref:glucose-6-phosphate 1-epimerase n=1 Tax=Heracleum sosnowskyi TaxID=360622 RepID=A0AAD8IMD6_9APIA|nr:Glucose-6-phosphate 1-epimerase [Heracleum sosnowskyi]
MQGIETKKKETSSRHPLSPGYETTSTSKQKGHPLNLIHQFQNVEVVKGINGLDKVVLRQIRGSSAEIYLYGGHVTSWKNDRGEQLLFVSNKATFKPPKAIRGGIPICFPQFSDFGSLEKHGFARNRMWSIDTNPPPFSTNSPNKASIDLILKPSKEDLKIFPHSFEFRLRVTLAPGGELTLTSRIRNANSDRKPFKFTFAYHTYFSVSDISEVRVEGLETLDYLDNMHKKNRFTEQGDALTFESEVDKVYLSSPTEIAFLDHEKKRTILIRKNGLPDAVVWNPWDKKSKAMADFGDYEYKLTLILLSRWYLNYHHNYLWLVLMPGGVTDMWLGCNAAFGLNLFLCQLSLYIFIFGATEDELWGV